MPDVPFQYDLKVELKTDPWEKATLKLSETGDLQTVEGHEKLVEQLLRAVVNDDTALTEMLNSTAVTERQLNTLFNLILRNFKQTQIDAVKKSDPDFNGFIFSRKAAGTTEEFEKVSTDPIIHKFVDENLDNGTEYTYGIAKMYRNVYETFFTEKMSLTPSAFLTKQTVLIGSDIVGFSQNRQCTFYVNYNRRFKASELLDKIISISAQQDDVEPRRYVVQVVVQDLRGNQASVAARRLVATTL